MSHQKDNYPIKSLQIKESTPNKVNKPKFILEQYTLLAEVKKIHDTTNNENIYTKINEHISNTWNPIPTTEEGIDTIWNLLCNKNKLSEHIKVYFPITTNTTKKETASLEALLIRIERFKLKIVTLEVLESHATLKLAVIKHKMELIRTALKQKKIYFNAKAAPSVFEVTYLSTISTIAKTISESEYQLREFLQPLTAAYKIVFTTYIFQEPKIVNAILSIAPPGFTGIEGDFYYILRLLQEPTLNTIFDENQLKQWNSYGNETVGLFSLLCLFPEVNLERLMLNLSRRIINQPYKNITSTGISKHTFSLIVEVCNCLIPELWIIVLMHYGDYITVKNNSPVSSLSFRGVSLCTLASHTHHDRKSRAIIFILNAIKMSIYEICMILIWFCLQYGNY